MAIDGDDERETDCGFRRGNGDGKDGDHHAGRILRRRPKPPESDEVQIRGRQHELDPDEDEDGVAPAERREQPDREKRGRDDEAELESGRHGISPPGKRARLARWFWRLAKTIFSKVRA